MDGPSAQPLQAEGPKDRNGHKRRFADGISHRQGKTLLGKLASGGLSKLPKGEQITAAHLDALEGDKWFELRLSDDTAPNQLATAAK